MDEPGAEPNQEGVPSKSTEPTPTHQVEPPLDEPPPEQLSPSAIDKRLRRIMTPRASGALKVPQEVVDQWKDLSSRHKVTSMFEKVGYDPDRGFQKNFALVQFECFHPLPMFSRTNSQ